MTRYIQVLMALESLLDKVGERQWRDWLRQDIELWGSKEDVSHHLSAYGGMGSFNDVWISVGNGHTVTKAQEPWVNNLFEYLKGLCFRLAHHPSVDESIEDVHGNRYVPSFSAFAHGLDETAVAAEASQLAQIISELNGWRCLKCGHSETKTYDIENYLARIVLPKSLVGVKTDRELGEIVGYAVTIEFPGLDKERDHLRQVVLDSNISIADREGWMRPCPKCGSDDTAVYRWWLNDEIFHPSEGNLPLRK